MIRYGPRATSLRRRASKRQTDACGQQEIVGLGPVDGVTEIAIAESHLPAQEPPELRHDRGIESGAEFSCFAEIRIKKKPFGESRAFGKFAAQVFSHKR